MVELPIGEFTLEQDSNISEYYLFSSISILSQDEEIDASYSLLRCTGTILAYANEYDENWTEKEKEDNTTQASLLEVTLTSGDFSFSTLTDSEGNFSITLPGDLEYVLKASTTASTYGVGLLVAPDNSMVELGDIYLNPLVRVTGNLYLDDNVTSWDAQRFNGMTPEIIAIDENNVEWQAQTSAYGEFTLDLASGN